MKSRIDSCCKNLAESEIWKDASSPVSDYIVKIFRAGESLHKILFRLFPENELQVSKHLKIKNINKFNRIL